MRLPLVAAGIAVLGILLLALAGPAYRMGAALPTAFGFLRWGAYVGAAGVLAGLLAAWLAYRRLKQPEAAAAHARGALALSIAAVVVGIVAVGIPLTWQRRAASAPPIHDISTDLENPPMFEAIVPLRADAPNSLERPPNLAELQRIGYPDLAPVTLPMGREEAFDRALAVAQEKGWEIVSADRDAGRIEAIDTTTWFGFTDDVVVRLTPWGSGTRVDVRSVSRVGRSDVGTNARRIRDYLESLE